MNSKLWLAAAAVPSLAALALADGNVDVTVDPVTRELRIVGDAAPNDIEVTTDGAGGAQTVTGRNATTVNGLPSVSVTDTRAVLIDMDAGNDVVSLSGTRIRSALRVRLGEGADTLTLSGVRIRGRVAVRAEEGSDRVVVRDGSVLLGTLWVAAGADDDDVEMRDSVFRGRVMVLTGAGDNSVVAQNASFNRFAQFVVRGSDGNDLLEVDGCAIDNDLKADLRGGEDHVILAETNFNLKVDLDGGGGNDDDLDVRSGVNFSRPPSFRSFEE